MGVWARDTLGDARASIKGVKGQMQDLDKQLQAATDPAVGRELNRQKLELRNELVSLRGSEEQLNRDGHHSALRVLNGHVALVAGCAWREDNNKTAASILSCSWDQTIQLFNLSLQGLA